MNNLRIDVILPSERRSSSPIRVRFVLNMFGLVVAALLIISAVMFVANVKMWRHRAKAVAEALVAMNDRLKVAQESVKIRDDLRSTITQLEAWNKCRLPYRDFLLELQNLVPEQIQLTRLDATDSIGAWERTCMIEISGVAEGNDPKSDVDTLVLNLKNTSGLTSIVDKAEVVQGSYKPAATGGEAASHRLFSIRLSLRPRQFATPPAKGEKSGAAKSVAAKPARAAPAKKQSEEDF